MTCEIVYRASNKEKCEKHAEKLRNCIDVTSSEDLELQQILAKPKKQIETSATLMANEREKVNSNENSNLNELFSSCIIF